MDSLPLFHRVVRGGRIALLPLLLLTGACASRPQLEMSAAALAPVPGWKEMTPRAGGASVWVSPGVVITSADVERASRGLAEGHPALQLTLTPAGATKLAALSEKQLGQPLAMLVDGELVWAPLIRSKLGGDVTIAAAGAGLSEKDVDRLVEGLNGPDESRGGP